ncbi:MAG: hypothetical protein CV080_10850, partial [Candidatus Kuenenia stuttgartiensis]
LAFYVYGDGLLAKEYHTSRVRQEIFFDIYTANHFPLFTKEYCSYSMCFITVFYKKNIITYQKQKTNKAGFIDK